MSAVSRGKIEELLAILKQRVQPPAPEGARITVHAAVSRFSVLYEKIRNAVDYRDEHLLRKAAIVRMLKRQMGMASDPMALAQSLLRELIAARYLPNATVPDATIAEVAVVVRKYLAIKSARRSNAKHLEWLLGVIAAELDDFLDAHRPGKGLVSFLFEQIGDRITLKGYPMEEDERRLQILIASHRLLIKADEEMLGYRLLRVFVPAWMRPEEWIAAPSDMALQLVGVEQHIRRELKHPLAQKFLASVKPLATALLILREIVFEKPDAAHAILEDQKRLDETVALVAETKYKESAGKLRRGTVRAMIYLLFTKMIFALAIEVPFERYFFHTVHQISLAINISFPPVIMLLVGRLIGIPGKDNTARLQACVHELLSEEGPSPREIKIAAKRSLSGRFFFNLAYLAMFFLSFGLIFYLLDRAHFTWVSSAIFWFFLCIVSFFAFRLRLAAREYVVIDRRDKTSSVIVDLISLPILRAGQWLSLSISRINIFIFLFDFIIETPFKVFLNVLEEWFAYLKEKKEELL